ncbi:MAG: hypothetical protein HRT99_00695 [Mycoplasmatales bacterium]|nr:hypothetical protein [Mycoplasmatales bacterium]
MWLHIGNGNIGKALIAPFLKSLNINYNITDINTDNLKENYEIFVDGKPKKINGINVKNLSEIDFSKIKVISTSVRMENLKYLIDTIRNISSKSDFSIVPFENSFKATTFLREQFPNIDVFDSVIDKIVSNNKKIYTESYFKISIDQNLSKYVSINKKYLTHDVELEHKVKYYSVNGLHAALAYLGAQKEYKFIWQCANDPLAYNITKIFEDWILKNLKYKINMDEILDRFKNQKHDTIKRVGRNPDIKSMKNENLKPIWESNEESIINLIHEGVKKWKDTY